MQLSELTLVAFLCLGAFRCLSYVPQIIRIARDKNGASAISYLTWCTWTLTNLATAAYAICNLGDPYLAAVSCIYAACCAAVIVLTAFKRAQHRDRERPANLPAEDRPVPDIARRLLASEMARLGRGRRPAYDPGRPLAFDLDRRLHRRCSVPPDEILAS